MLLGVVLPQACLKFTSQVLNRPALMAKFVIRDQHKFDATSGGASLQTGVIILLVRIPHPSCPFKQLHITFSSH